MAEDFEGRSVEDEDESVEEMIQHLDDAKEFAKKAKQRTRKTRSGTALQNKIARRADVAVLASNYPARLDELVANEKVTHRSSKWWKSAAIGVEAHGRLPIYYRLDGTVTHKGCISHIVLNPEENSSEVEKFIQHISDSDTYGDHSPELDTTTFIVTDGEELDEPFSQTELEKLSGDGPIAEGYSRQPAYVIQRPGDFPDFP